MTGSALWNKVCNEGVLSPNAYLVFDDAIVEKNFSHCIELVRRQYTGNKRPVIKGIGVVNCVYVNPDIDAHGVVDFPAYDPHGDGKRKLDHVRDMLTNLLRHKCLPFAAVLMDTWYATRKLMCFIESLQLCCYCSLESNRLVDDSHAQQPYRQVQPLNGSEQCQCSKARIQRNHIGCAVVWLKSPERLQRPCTGSNSAYSMTTYANSS